MNVKTRILTLAVCTLALAAPAPLFAAKGAKKEGKADKAGKAARPGLLLKKFDTDKNGAIDGTEAAALRKAFDKDPLRKLDANKDGTLEDTEIAAVKVRHGKGKAGAVKEGKRKKKKA